MKINKFNRALDNNNEILITIDFKLDNIDYTYCCGESKNTKKAIYGCLYKNNNGGREIVRLPLIEKQLKNQYNKGLLN